MLHAPIAHDRLSAGNLQHGGLARRSRDYLPEALGAMTAFVVSAIYLGIDPCPDVAWQLWIGHQLRYGARFYIDIIETNPPLWFWLAIPIDWLSGMIGARPAATMVGAMSLLSAISVVATGRLLDPRLSAPIRTAFLVYAGLVVMLLPLLDLGQREHVLLISTVPYVALAAGRHEQRAVSPWFAAAIGVGSAIGFALKHYFLIAPALLELWLLASLRHRYRPVRPETVALTAVGALYAVAVLTLTPAYLRDIVPMLRLTYGALRVRDVGGMIGIVQCYWAFALCILLLRADLVARTPLAAAFVTAAFGFAAAWLIQFKGWPNHCVPVTGCLTLAIAAAAASDCRTSRSWFALLTPTVLIYPMTLAVLFTPYRNPLEDFAKPMLAGLGRTDSVAFVSENSTLAWPLTLDRGFRYPSRHYGMWMFTAFIEGGAKDPALMRIERRVVEETAQDYSCAQPMRIFFHQKARTGGFDMEKFFFSSERFAALMRHYRRIGRYYDFDGFQRIAPFRSPPAGSCRRGV